MAAGSSDEVLARASSSDEIVRRFVETRARQRYEAQMGALPLSPSKASHLEGYEAGRREFAESVLRVLNQQRAYVNSGRYLYIVRAMCERVRDDG